MRLTVFISLFVLAAGGAEAAPAFKSAAARTSEKGVTVWRGSSHAEDAPALQGADARSSDCAGRLVVLQGGARWPARRLRIHRISSDEFPAPYFVRYAFRSGTQGFWEDEARR